MKFLLSPQFFVVIFTITIRIKLKIDNIHCNNYLYYLSDVILCFQLFSPRTHWCQTSRHHMVSPCLFAPHTPNPDCDPTATKQLPRTRTKPPGQRRSLTSVLSTVHRHSPRKPLASFDRTRAQHKGKSWHGDARLLSPTSCGGRVKGRTRDRHSPELNVTSVNFTKLNSFFILHLHFLLRFISFHFI